MSRRDIGGGTRTHEVSDGRRRGQRDLKRQRVTAGISLVLCGALLGLAIARDPLHGQLSPALSLFGVLVIVLGLGLLAATVLPLIRARRLHPLELVAVALAAGAGALAIVVQVAFRLRG